MCSDTRDRAAAPSAHLIFEQFNKVTPRQYKKDDTNKTGIGSCTVGSEWSEQMVRLIKFVGQAVSATVVSDSALRLVHVLNEFDKYRLSIAYSYSTK